MAKVKISGIAGYDDALDATNLGADFIAFSFVKDSPKKVSEKLAADTISKLPPFVAPIVIFADEEQKVIAKIVKKCALKYIQFDGLEAPEFCNAAREALSVKVFKSFKLENEESLANLAPYASSVDYFILDVSYMDGEVVKQNFELAAKASQFNVPFFIAGNITKDDVKRALEIATPFGIDGDSGIERLPKRKDYDKMNDFIRFGHGLK